MTRELTIQEFGLFETPIKTVWSEFHKKLFILCKYLVYTFDTKSFEFTPFQETESHEFIDLDISINGNIALLLQSGFSGEIKILSPNLFSIVKTTKVSNCTLAFAKFAKERLIVVSKMNIQGQDSETSTSKIFFIVPGTKNSVNEGVVNTKGDLVGIDINNENIAISVSTGGDVVRLPTETSEFEGENSSESSNWSGAESDFSESSLDILRFEPEILGNIGPGVSSFSASLKNISVSETLQKKVRVFVGSKPGLNDRWDSESINTEKTSILYGGGDNLIPGRNYWVHISVWHEDSGWSSPQIKKFTMPVRYYNDSSSQSSESSSLSSLSSISSSTKIMTTSSSHSSISSPSSLSSSSSSQSSPSSLSSSSSSISSPSSPSSSSSSSSSESSFSSSSSSSKSSSSTEHFYDTGSWQKESFTYTFGGGGSVSSAFQGLNVFNLLPPNDNNTNNGRVWVHGEVVVTMNVSDGSGGWNDNALATITVYRDSAKTDLIASGAIGKSNWHPYFNSNTIYDMGNGLGNCTIEPAYIDPLHPFTINNMSTGFWTFISYTFDDIWIWTH